MILQRLGLLQAGLLAALLPFAAAAQSGCKPAEGMKVITPGTLTATTSPTVPPLQYIDENGKIIGMDVELGEAIAARLCLKLNMVASEFVTMIPALKAGRYDMIDTFMYYTPDRAAQIHMIPYGAATVSIVVPNKAAMTTAGLPDFSGKPFGTQLGSMDDVNARAASKLLIEAGKPGIDVHTFPSYAEVLQAVAAGQVDGAIVSTDSAFYYKSNGTSFFRIVASGLFPHAETIGFADPALAEKAAEALNAMKADGSYDKLLGGYHHCALPGPFKVTTGPIPDPVCPSYSG